MARKDGAQSDGYQGNWQHPKCNSRHWVVVPIYAEWRPASRELDAALGHTINNPLTRTNPE